MIGHKHAIVIGKCRLLIVDELVEMKRLSQLFVEYHRVKNLFMKKMNNQRSAHSSYH